MPSVSGCTHCGWKTSSFSVKNVHKKFHSTFNSIYCRSMGASTELISVQLFKSYCLRFISYVTEKVSSVLPDTSNMFVKTRYNYKSMTALNLKLFMILLCVVDLVYRPAVLLVVKIGQMAPLYQITLLLHLVQIDMFMFARKI